MAMTKAEKAKLAALDAELALVRALRWTAPVQPDLPVPEFGQTTSGWQINTYSGRVYEAWSESAAHGEGKARGSYGSQKGIPLYSTRLLALQAMRAAVELECAQKLAAIDAQIAKEVGQ